MWEVAGKKICEYRENKDNEQMLFANYTEQSI